ncbi:hypothetical protein [Limimaricola cinnabarinus]|uniref:hypothetical protein n=1 Tax=Limimaricola cinnabarinus TaxID=1125964 RepID=UPI002FE2BCDE
MKSDMARTIAETEGGDQTCAKISFAAGCFILPHWAFGPLWPASGGPFRAQVAVSGRAMALW